MYWIQRKLLSQNFLRNRELVKSIVRSSSITKADLVLEIGPGEGIITSALIPQAKQVIAVELDQKLVEKLKRQFGNRLEIVHQDFRTYILPTTPYKVFSNLPFRFTGEIFKKLYLGINPPTDGYLIMQHEAARRFGGKTFGSNNTLLSVLLYPWFDMSIIHQFRPTDFFPIPRVQIVLLRISQLAHPLVSTSLIKDYRDFVTFTFGQMRNPTAVSYADWLVMFNLHQNQDSPKRKRQIEGAFAKWQTMQSNLSKIHRTRKDRNWKKFRV